MIAHSFIDALASDGPAADRADKMKLYGWLIGRWTMDATVHLDDGSRHKAPEKSTSAGRSKAAPFRTSGFCRAFSRHDASSVRPKYRRLAHPVE